ALHDLGRQLQPGAAAHGAADVRSRRRATDQDPTLPLREVERMSEASSFDLPQGEGGNWCGLLHQAACAAAFFAIRRLSLSARSESASFLAFSKKGSSPPDRSTERSAFMLMRSFTFCPIASLA